MSCESLLNCCLTEKLIKDTVRKVPVGHAGHEDTPCLRRTKTADAHRKTGIPYKPQFWYKQCRKVSQPHQLGNNVKPPRIQAPGCQTKVQLVGRSYGQQSQTCMLTVSYTMSEGIWWRNFSGFLGCFPCYTKGKLEEWGAQTTEQGSCEALSTLPLLGTWRQKLGQYVG